MTLLRCEEQKISSHFSVCKNNFDNAYDDQQDNYNLGKINANFLLDSTKRSKLLNEPNHIPSSNDA